MHKRASVSAIALFACASLAMAADLEGPSYGSLKDDIPAPTAYRWDGIYIGGHLGWASVSPKGGFDCSSYTRLTGKNGSSIPLTKRAVCGDELLKERVNTGDENGPRNGTEVNYFTLGQSLTHYVALIESTSSGTDSGLMGGVQVGINHQIGNLVFSLEGDWSGFGDIEGKTTTVFDYFTRKIPGGSLLDYQGTGEVTIKNDLDWLATFRARLGAVLTDDGRLLGYVTGGAAVAKVSNSITATLTPDNLCNGCTLGPSSSGSFYQFGGVIGAGLEYAMTDNLTIGAEYLYVNLLGQEENGVTFRHQDGRSFSIREKTGFDDIHTIKVKANFKFGN